MLAGITSVSAATGAATAANAGCDYKTTNALATMIRISHLSLAALTASLLLVLLRLMKDNGADRAYACPLAIRIQRSFYYRFAIAADPGSLNLTFV
jgi:hypothetical protein